MCRCPHSISRRRLLGGIGAVGTAAVAGCFGRDEADPAADVDPERLDDGVTCDVCGMIIENGYGPNGQVHFDGEYPSDRDRPAYYDSVRELYLDVFTQERRGTDPIVGFVTDYATVDYGVESRSNELYITGSIDPDTFVVTDRAVYVIGSGLKGTMGPELLPFSDRDRASTLVDEHGGNIVAAADVTEELVGSM